MSLKYKLITTPNPNYSIDKIRILQTIVSKLRGINKQRLVKEPNEDNSDDDEYTHDDLEPTPEAVADTLQDINNTVKEYRKDLKRALGIIPYKKYIQVTSDKVWRMYNEEFDDETGRTKYTLTEDFIVNEKIEYNKNGVMLKEAIKDIQARAMDTLKTYRENRQKINTTNKEYKHPSLEGLPINATYEVAVGGGMGGPAQTVVYKDKWRGTEYSYEVPEVTNNYNIHLKGGTFLELQKATKMRRIFERKVPTTNDHHVGVEIEFISKYDKYKLAGFLLDEEVQEYVHLVDDGSLRPEDEYTQAHEITVLAPERIINLVVERVLKAINKDKGSKVNFRCGLHVHLDMRNRDKKTVFYNLVKAQRIMYAMNPRNRFDGTREDGRKGDVYSKRMELSDFDAAERECNGSTGRGSRYVGVNPLAYNKHKTIEVRIHSGSTNLEKICNWITILTRIANMTTMVEHEASKPETFCEYYGLDNTMLEYIKARIAKFKDTDGKHITLNEAA